MVRRPPLPSGVVSAVKKIFRQIFSKVRRKPKNQRKVDRVGAIDLLPDEILLEIFKYYRLGTLGCPSSGPWEWHRLTHVCRRWRSVIFASPQNLDLRLFYTYHKPIRKTLDFWPPLPITIWYPRLTPTRSLSPQDEHNIISALTHPNRIREINLTFTNSISVKACTLLRAQFNTLEYLWLQSQDTMTTLPIGFLGGSTPRLRDVHLDGISFPTLPVLLLSTRNLVSLRLESIPMSGYFPPDTFAIGLSTTTQLEYLEVHFLPQPPPARWSRNPPPRDRHVLPALTGFQFTGESGYLEDLVARINAPVLKRISITFFEELTCYIPRFSQFVRRAEELRSPRHTYIRFLGDDIVITNDYQHPSCPQESFHLKLSCYEPDQQVPLLAHICEQFCDLFAGVERLEILLWSGWFDPKEDVSEPWIELFRPFKAVKRLDVTGTLVPSIASALERDTARYTLPALRDLYLNAPQGSISTCIEPFITARKLSARPVSVYYWGGGSFDTPIWRD